MLSASSSDAVALWSAALDTLAGRLSPRVRAALASATAPLCLGPTTLRVAARASEIRDWIGAGSVALLIQAVERLTDGNQALALAPVADGASLIRDPRLEFASFIVSPSNASARDRVRAIAWGESSAPAPVLLRGPSAAGKTHLLRCASAALADHFPEALVALSGEALVLQLVAALREDSLAEFRARLRGARALVIDGLESLEGRDATQEELAAAIGAVLGRGGPVLIGCSRPPEQLRDLAPELLERLAAAEVLDLSLPGWETRVAIVLDRFAAWRVKTNPEIASYVAAQLRSDLEPLDACLTRLIGESESTTRLDDLDLVQQILDAGRRRAARMPPEQVIQLVARHFNVRLHELRSAARSPRVAMPRQIAMYLLRRHCGLSYPEIGRQFRRHHTTALHSDRVVRRQLQVDGNLRSAVVLLEKELRNSPERGG